MKQYRIKLKRRLEATMQNKQTCKFLFSQSILCMNDEGTNRRKTVDAFLAQKRQSQVNWWRVLLYCDSRPHITGSIGSPLVQTLLWLYLIQFG